MVNKNKLAWIILSFFLLVFFLIEFKGLNHLEPSDEHIYFYMGKMISQGFLPYNDFFHAHPPLKVYIIALIFKLFGFNLIILKLIPLLCYLISSFFLFKLIKEKFNEITALLAVFLFLFSFRVMLEATYFMGMDITTMFLIIGYYYLFKIKYYKSGFFLGLAGLSGLYSLVPIVIIFVYLLIKNKSSFLKLLAGFSIFFIINILFFVLSKNYLVDVYLYHLLKPEVLSNRIDIFIEALKENWLIFFSFFLFIILLIFKFVKKIELKNINILYLSGVISLAYLLFLLSLNKIFNYYFVLLFPFLAIIGSYSIYYIFNSLIRYKIIYFIIVIFVIYIFWNISADSLYLNQFDFDNFDNARVIASYVEGQEGNLFGDDSTVPLIALMANKEVALDIIDSNDMVFESKVVNLTDVLQKLEKQKVIMILRPLKGIGLINEMKLFVNKCELKKQVKDSLRGDFLIYKCSG